MGVHDDHNLPPNEGGTFRVARRTNHFAAAVGFYRDLVGLPRLQTFEPHGPDGFAGAIFGLPGASATFELVSAAERVPSRPRRRNRAPVRTSPRRG